MKRIKIITVMCSILLISIISSYSQVSKYVTTQFQVKGVCDQCKNRIENAAYIKGVKHCEWNIQSELLRITYDSTKIELIKIHESIANAGHATDKVPAYEDAYNKLPKCCKYNSGADKH